MTEPQQPLFDLVCETTYQQLVDTFATGGEEPPTLEAWRQVIHDNWPAWEAWLHQPFSFARIIRRPT